MAGAQTVSAGFGHAPSLGPDLLHVGVILRQALFTQWPDGPEQLQAVILPASSPDRKKKNLFSNYLQLGPIGQAWNTGFHQGQEWGQPLSHSEWLLEDNHSATTRRRGDARWAQV